ncbi:MAG: MATE family efflux transporter [Myxococcota bacterium]|nr:MATE family efflux transporter [Myxococcota bacterium]MEE2673989.1 MATE family efflux transporter [Myxococcota bacterium]
MQSDGVTTLQSSSAPATDYPGGGEPPGRWQRLTQRDHTRGSLVRSMWVLSIPLMLSSVLGGLVLQLVDLSFITRLGEDSVTAIVVSNQSLRQVIFMMMMGAATGAQALLARNIGAGDRESADHVAGQVFALGLGVSLLFAMVGLLYAEPMLSLMNVSPTVLAIGTPYLRLTFLLSFGFVLHTMFGAIMNGAGDTTTPLVVILVSTIVTLLAEWALIFGNLGMPVLGVQGVVWGVLVGQLASGAIALRIIVGRDARVRLHVRHLWPDWSVIRQIVSLSWAPAIQMTSQFLVAVFFIRLLGSMGEQAQAAYSIGLRISMMGPAIAFPLAGACATLVGQNLGAGRVDRAWRSIGVGIACNVAILWPLAGGLVLFRTEIMELLATDPEVIRIGSELFLYQGAGFCLWAFHFVFMRGLQGAGDMTAPMLISIVGALGVTLPVGFGLAEGLGWGPTGVFVGTLAGSFVSTTATGLYMATGRWTRRELRG